MVEMITLTSWRQANSILFLRRRWRDSWNAWSYTCSFEDIDRILTDKVVMIEDEYTFEIFELQYGNRWVPVLLEYAKNQIDYHMVRGPILRAQLAVDLVWSSLDFSTAIFDAPRTLPT
jgi:hypothetical protein